MRTKIIVSLFIFTLLVCSGSASAFSEGSYNNYFGNGAGGPGGTFNSFFGAYAGADNTGDSNAFYGYDAGTRNTTGYNNTFIGHRAGWYNTTGHNSTFNGYYAGANNEGDYNTFIGNSAGFNNEGDYNTFIGNRAGRATTGDYNTFNGALAGFSNTIGHSNTFNGADAGSSNIGGSHNTFIGVNAGASNSGGSRNTFIGVNAGFSNTGGPGNVFLGYDAGFSETGSDRLYIDNSNTSTPLIYGEFDNDIVVINGALTANSFTGDGSGLTGITGAEELGEFCWDVRNGAGTQLHLLVLQVTQHGSMYSLHGKDSLNDAPVHGNAFLDSLGRISFGVNIPWGFKSYTIWAPMSAVNLSTSNGERQSIESGVINDTVVSVNHITCP